MSRVGQSIINIPDGIEVKKEGNKFFVKGSKGELSAPISEAIDVTIDQKVIKVEPKDLNSRNKALWGTTRAHVANLIKGVSEGFSKTLEMNGTGYRASISGTKLKLQLGYSHDIDYEVPKEIKVEISKQNTIKLSGSNKEKLGAVAANIRSFRKPEPFKGKGIKYDNEFIFRKEGKKK